MRIAASIQRLILSILLACSGHLWAYFAFTGHGDETAREDASFRPLSFYPVLHAPARFAEITFFPARYYFGPFAIGPPRGREGNEKRSRFDPAFHFPVAA